MLLMIYRSVVLFTLLLLCQSLISQNQIWLDEDVVDWEGITTGNIDPVNDNSNNTIDFVGMHVNNDEEFLYIRLKLTADLDIQENNELAVYIDTDNDASTGLSIDGIGADFRYFFGQRNGNVTINGQQKSIGHYDMGVVSLPTVTSDYFEICIRRSGILDANNFEMQDKIQLFFKDNRTNGDRVPDLGGFDYSMNNLSQELPQYQISKGSELLRVMSFNVLQDGIFDNQQKEPIKRIIKATRPDVIGFQEIYDYSGAQVMAVIEDLFPSDDWYQAKVSPDIITISKYPITNTFSTDGNGFFLIEHPTRDILFCNAHLPCCDKDSDRQEEVDKMMAFIRESKKENSTIPLVENTPIVIVGDMNLVGLKRQQTTLVTGDIKNVNLFGADFNPDWDETPFMDAIPYTTGYPGAITWSNPFSSFGPGRLDYIIYSDSQLELENSFVVNTARMDSELLSDLDLQSSDSNEASDHFAVLADFKFVPTVSTGDALEKSIEFKVWPNPTEEEFNVVISDSANKEMRLHLIESGGKYIRLLENTTIRTNRFYGNYKLNNLVSGHYLIKLEVDGESSFRNLIIK